MLSLQSRNVIFIRQRFLLSDLDREVADLAYSLWVARAFHGGSPEETLLAAIQEVKGDCEPGLFVVPKRSPAPGIPGRLTEFGCGTQ